jgi:hypothetical protein
MFDTKIAQNEGWDLFDVDGRLQLQKIDDPTNCEWLDYNDPKFKSDADAIIFVAMKANEGSAYHREAIELIGSLAE